MPMNPLPQHRDPALGSIRRDNRDATYGAAFLQANRMDHGPCSVAFGDVLWAMFQPSSVVEFGCASAYTLWALQRHGVAVKGYDISPAAKAFANEVGGPDLAAKVHAPVDLNEPPAPTDIGRHEVALSIEVLEHLHPSSASRIVAAICAAAPVAVITACPPVGRNALHLNEQPFAYWIEMFELHGHVLDTTTTNAIRGFMRAMKEQGNITVPSWYFSGYFAVFRSNG